MKHFICLSTLFAVATAAGYYYPAPPTELQDPLLRSSFSSYSSSSSNPIQQQYHTQDAYGQYSYGYSEPLSSKQETRSLDGVTRGTYSYRDAVGIIQTVAYVADVDGFRVAATNLPRANLEAPKPVEDTPEVMAARAQHLAAHRQATLRSSDSSIAATAELPRPVEDTPEVATAKVAFFKLYEEELLRHKLLHNKQASAASNTLLRTQPIIAGNVPESSYHPVYVSAPSGGFAYYKFAVPAPKGAYLPVA